MDYGGYGWQSRGVYGLMVDKGTESINFEGAEPCTSVWTDYSYLNVVFLPQLRRQVRFQIIYQKPERQGNHDECPNALKFGDLHCPN